MNKWLVIIVVAVIILAGAILIFGKNRGNNSGEPVVGVEMPVPGAEGVEEMIVNTEGRRVTYTDAGFSPNPLTVKKGETVTFVNESASPFWPASAMHPTHKVYPGSDIGKCGTAEAFKIFDACRGVPVGESWSFTFNEVGSWNYHDHLNTKNFGKIIVEQ